MGACWYCCCGAGLELILSVTLGASNPVKLSGDCREWIYKGLILAASKWVLSYNELFYNKRKNLHVSDILRLKQLQR